ncbi:MAG: hypothetical protein R2704_18325 [Microthrixaceae bacterium]
MSAAPHSPVARRRTFLAAAGLGAGAAWLSACSGDDTEEGAPTGAGPATTATDPAGAADTEALTPAMFEALAICALTPGSSGGPFPSREQLDRRDVTDGYPGHPLRLGLRVVDEGCRPVAGSQVEIWHTDATGDYSSYVDDGSGKDEGEGTTFMRGFQTSDADGLLEFQTIYPGWYGGRAVHIHVRARVEGTEVLTAQLYFDEDYTESVFRTGEYERFGPPDTGWADDGLIGDPAVDGTGIALTEAPTSKGAGTLGLVNLGVPVAR